MKKKKIDGVSWLVEDPPRAYSAVFKKATYLVIVV